MQKVETTVVYLTDEPPMPCTGAVLNVPIMESGEISQEAWDKIERQVLASALQK